MKVLHLLGVPVDAGGVLSVIRNLQEASDDLGLTHAVWVNSHYVETRTPSLDYRFSPWALGEGPVGARMVGSIIPSFLAVRRLLATEHFDVVHAHSRGTLPVAVMVARLLRRPAIFTNHAYASRRDLYRRASEQPGLRTVVLSQDMADYYRIDAGSPSVEIISACCSDRFFDEPLVERSSGFSPENPLRLAGVGIVVPWKGWMTACQAIDLLSPEERACVRFDHWGPIDLAEDHVAELRRFVTEHDLADTIRLRGSTDGIADVLRTSDWLLHPAVNDPFPVAVLEALTMGLPVIATSSGGPARMVRDGVSGVHFEPNDARGLAKLLREVLRGDCTVGSPAEVRESVRPMSATLVARRYADLYGQVVAERS